MSRKGSVDDSLKKPEIPASILQVMNKGQKMTEKFKTRNRIGNKGLLNQNTTPNVARKSSRNKTKGIEESKLSSANTTGGI